MEEHTQNSRVVVARRRRFLLWGLGIVIVLVALFILPIPLGSIQVNGSKHITELDIIAAGNLRKPVNILQVKTKVLEDNLNHDLRIEKSTVSYKLPLTLQVDIKERRPIAIVVTQFGYATIDKNGQVIQLDQAITDSSVPILSGIKLGNTLLGDTIKEENVLKALIYLNALTEENIKNISELNIGDTSSLVGYTVDGLAIHIGDTTDLPEKAKLTEDMLKDVKARNVNAIFIDVNIKAPYIKVQ